MNALESGCQTFPQMDISSTRHFPKTDSSPLESSSRNTNELRSLRNELGELGGVGHFFGNDKGTWFLGDREPMEDRQLKNILQLLSLGEKKINLKEREFRAIFSEKKTKRNSKKSLGILWGISKSPRPDGRLSSSLIGN